MSDSLYMFLTNMQIAIGIMQPISMLAGIVALIVAIVAMVYVVKALKIYIAKNAAFKPVKGGNADTAPCQCCAPEKADDEAASEVESVSNIAEEKQVAETKEQA